MRARSKSRRSGNGDDDVDRSHIIDNVDDEHASCHGAHRNAKSRIGHVGPGREQADSTVRIDDFRRDFLRRKNKTPFYEGNWASDLAFHFVDGM